jgi:hypothetical protein
MHNPDYHPEGDHSLDAHLHRMLDVYINEQYARGAEGLNQLYAIIFHDIGKKATAEWMEERGFHQFTKHESAGQDIINDAWNDLGDKQLAMEYVARFHTDFWQLTNVQKMRNLASNPYFTLIAHLCRIDKMMDGDAVLFDNRSWVIRCGEFKKAMQPTEKEQTDFIKSCFALMGMRGNYTGWEMAKVDGQVTVVHTGADVDTLDELLRMIETCYNLSNPEEYLRKGVEE